MSILETWKCDRPGCDEESPPTPTTKPYGWVLVERYDSDPDDDTIRHYCGWECAMHGTAHELEVYERHLEGADETH